MREFEEEERLRSEEASEADEAGIEEWDVCESSPELVELSPIEFFSSAFRKQSSAPEGLGKRDGKSNRSIRRHKKAKRDLEVQGFLSLPEFLKLKAVSARQQHIQRDDMHKAEAEVMGTVCSAKGGTASTPVVFEEEKEESAESAEEGSVHVFQAEEEEEEDESADAFLLQVGDNNETTSICASKEEEEEEESEAEGKNDKTGQDTHTAEGGTMSTLQLSRGNRGPSRWG
ncbi:hypothetical protein V8E53_002632 [Lactarius tabidus]